MTVPSDVQAAVDRLLAHYRANPALWDAAGRGFDVFSDNGPMNTAWGAQTVHASPETWRTLRSWCDAAQMSPSQKDAWVALRCAYLALLTSELALPMLEQTPEAIRLMAEFNHTALLMAPAVVALNKGNK